MLHITDTYSVIRKAFPRRDDDINFQWYYVKTDIGPQRNELNDQ